MNTSGIRVAVVFTQVSGGDLCCFAGYEHVWLLNTPDNIETARWYWSEQAAGRAPPPLARTLTTFRLPGPTVEVALDAVLEMLEEHHGEFAEGPMVREVLLVGIEPTAAMLETLSGWDYSVCTSTAEATICVRS